MRDIIGLRKRIALYGRDPSDQCLVRGGIIFFTNHIRQCRLPKFRTRLARTMRRAKQPVNANLGNAGYWDSNGPNVSRNDARNSYSYLGLGCS